MSAILDSAFGEWRIDFESKTAVAGQTGLTMDVIASWDVDLGVVSIPIVVREVDPGTFRTGILPYGTNGVGGTILPLRA